MTTVEQALATFLAAWEAGEQPDPTEHAERLPAEHRIAFLDHVTDALLRTDATPVVDLAAVAPVQELLALSSAAAGVWPMLLPRLREQAGLSTSQVAQRIAETFDVAGEEARTQRYLERLERGELAADRVSQRLLAALGRWLGTTGAQLRAAAGLAAPAPALLFRAESDPGAARAAALDALADAAFAPAPADAGAPDPIDALFCGGPGA